MRRQCRFLGFFLCLVVTQALFSGYAVSAPRLALIYNGVSSDANSALALETIAKKAGYDTAYFADPKAMTASLGGASLLIFGGTEDNITPLLSLFNTADTIQAMKNFVSNGGVYLGICGGAFIASEGWEEATGFTKALGLAPVRTDLYLTNPDPIIIKVSWGAATRPIYYQFGPRMITSAPDSIQVFSRYEDNTIAASVFNLGKGKVILLGHHPEAETSWVDATTKNAGDWQPTDDLSSNLLAIAADNSAPTVPSGLTATVASGSPVRLSWTASTDGVGVATYKVYRGTTLLATLGPATTYGDFTVAASTSYTYTVSACDVAGNCSAQTAPVTASIQSSASSFNEKADCLFNWAESSFPAFFAPKGTVSQTAGPYYLRYYTQSKAYLGVSSTNLYYFGPLSQDALMDLRAASTWFATAGCN